MNLPTGRELHQTREPRGLSPSGGKTPPKLLFPRALLRAYGAQSGVQGFTPCQTREPRGLSPSGGKTRPSRMSRYAPARLWRAVRGAGGHPLPCALRAQSGVKGLSPLLSHREGRELADVAEAEMLQKTIRGGVKNGTA